MSSTSSNVVEALNVEDEEHNLILPLLKAKVHGDPLPPTDEVIHECDLFGDKNPWEIWELLGGAKEVVDDDALYIFSTLRMNMASGDVVRAVGCGSWEDQHKDADIVCPDTKQIVAVKKCFWFDKSDTAHDGAWIMHEYRLLSSDPPSDLLRRPPSPNYSHVLCKLMKKQGRIRVRRMGQPPETAQTIMLPFPSNPSAPASNERWRLVRLGSEPIEAEVADHNKRLKVEKTTPDDQKNDQ